MFTLVCRSINFQKRAIFIIFFSIFSLIAEGQEVGVSLYAGITNARIHENIFCPKCIYQSGYVFGVDGRLNSGGFHFLISGDYTKIDLIPKEKIDYFSKDKLQLFKIKGGMGFRIIKFSEKTYLTSKAQMALTSFFNYNKAELIKNSVEINDGVLGATTGLMFHFGELIVELEYEYGLLNMFFEKPETKLDFLTLKTGFKF